MTIIARFRVKNRLSQKLRRENRLGRIGIVRVSDEATRAVIIDPASRRNYRNRIGHTQQQPNLEEVGEKLPVEGYDEGEVIQDFDTFQVSNLPADISFIAENMLGAINLAADLLNFRCHHQQHGEGIIPRRNLGAVGIIQIFRELHIIAVISVGILRNLDARNHIGVDHIRALVLIPVHQVIPMEKRTYINIRCVVAKHLGEEIAFHLGGMAYNQLFRKLRNGILLRNNSERPRCVLLCCGFLFLALKEPGPFIDSKSRSREHRAQHCHTENGCQNSFDPGFTRICFVLIHSSHPHGSSQQQCPKAYHNRQ